LCELALPSCSEAAPVQAGIPNVYSRAVRKNRYWLDLFMGGFRMKKHAGAAISRLNNELRNKARHSQNNPARANHQWWFGAV